MSQNAPPLIDLRSDTVTRPTAAMLQAMAAATLGDDSRDGDTTVQRLEALAAERMGKEAAVFLPSGTMANLVAVLTHTPRGGEIVLEAASHILNSELGGFAAVAGVVARPIQGCRGAMDSERLTQVLRKPGAQNFGTALVCMETTHNGAGGAVLPLDHMSQVQEIAGESDVPVHIDGARVFNAAAALRVQARDIAAHADSISFCLSKGLSAPVGSLLCGTSAFIGRARAFRRMLGGNMRQAGPLAAAGLIALEAMVARLSDDHLTAQRLGRGLCDIDDTFVSPADVETNIVRVDVQRSGRDASEWSARLKTLGVLVSPCDKQALRFVTHRHIGNAEVDAALDVFASVWRSMRPRSHVAPLAS